MQRTIMLIIMSVMVLMGGCAESLRPSMQSKEDKRVEKLLAHMTLEEKVGEMTQLTLEVVSKRKDDRSVEINMEKLREAIVTHHVGSILNCGGSANTIDNWHEIITTIQDVATKETRLAIPVIYGIDSIHGANYIVDGTLFPQNFAIAATGNVDLVRRASEITAMETRAAGIPWNFNPVLGLARNPLWPRFYETYGEDPYLASIFGAAYVEVQQGEDMSDPARVAACMKHYLGYSVPRTGKDRTPAHIPDRILREYFLKPFAAAAKVGVATCMVNSSEINGLPVHASKYYLIDILRNELGFEGFVVSDWNDINNLWQREKVAANQREAVKISVMAGVDMSMVPYDYSFTNHLIDLVTAGEVPMSRIDEAVRRILKVKFALGLFDNPYPQADAKANLATAGATALNLQAARECITLLKNENNLLPLASDKKVLVTGPTADLISVMNGGWTITWQGDREDLYPAEKLTVLEAIQAKIGAGNVQYVPGPFDQASDLNAILEVARQADVAIVCLGEKTYCETPGNIDDLNLPDAQKNLVEAITRANVPLVAVLLEGRPRLLGSVAEQADAIVMGYLPGQEGGVAIADVLFGDVNPSGKLPFTYPKHTGDLTLYDRKNSENYQPQWPFGHGLSYTMFKYENLVLSNSKIGVEDALTISVDVTNTGTRSGKEIVQLYLQDMVRSVTPPVRQLKRFVKVDLNSGEKRIVTFTLTKDDLSFIGEDSLPAVEPGMFKVYIGDQEAEFELM
ncbi:MAG: glycoside hydrolase family 3 C-terminal domain-containing protein [Sedimentisphaerales bacterium]|nr:glycoside hydrolase family 3 C-terminal domain-containing protein [Sedimentisphaerales bacterium]